MSYVYDLIYVVGAINIAVGLWAWGTVVETMLRPGPEPKEGE